MAKAKKVINLAAIEHGRILLVKKNSHLILPGGMKMARESYSHCLKREIAEELDGIRVDLGSLAFFDNFRGISPNRKYPVDVDVYLGRLFEPVRGVSGEINDFGWYDTTLREGVSAITSEILQKLQTRGYL